MDVNGAAARCFAKYVAGVGQEVVRKLRQQRLFLPALKGVGGHYRFIGLGSRSAATDLTVSEWFLFQ